MLLENGLWRLRVYRLRLRSQSGWGLEQNDTLKMQLLREQKFKRSFETEQHDTSAFWDKFQKKTHHWTPAAVARCHVLRQESYWEAPGVPDLNTIQYQQNLRLQIQNEQILTGRFFQAGRIAHMPQATQSCLWWATLARKNFGKLTTHPRNKEDLKLETTEASNLRLT